MTVRDMLALLAEHYEGDQELVWLGDDGRTYTVTDVSCSADGTQCELMSLGPARVRPVAAHARAQAKRWGYAAETVKPCGEAAAQGGVA